MPDDKEKGRGVGASRPSDLNRYNTHRPDSKPYKPTQAKKSSRLKTAGHITKKMRKLLGPPPRSQWIWLTREMINSPAWRSLSINARRVMDRLLEEHSAQGGFENGRLKVTYCDFEAAGIGRRLIPAAIAEVEHSGFAKRTFFGRRTCGEDSGEPAQFRLTWLPVFEPDDMFDATNEWKAFDKVFCKLPKSKDSAKDQRIEVSNG